ncbi:MAG: hypothetical protein ACXVCP_13055 [Bdellovibrio sp.]
MKQSFFLMLTSCLLPLFSQAATIEKIPVVGLDSNNQPTVIEVPTKSYSSNYKAAVSTINDSLMEAVNLNAPTNNTNQRWHLRTLTVGLGVSMEIGVGPVKIGAIPKSRLMFTNSTTPWFP